MFFGDKELIFDKPLIMGIINLTPDSFSDGGKFLKKNSDRDIDKNKVQKELEVLENNGASFIDIGAESTRPGHKTISIQQEIDRLMPILEIVSKSNCVISIDTRKPEVVYLDPMFPQRTKGARVKKEMQVFHQLIGKDSAAELLLLIAQECAQKRVVVKRPRIAPSLAGLKPNYTLEGKSNRYDIYLSH